MYVLPVTHRKYLMRTPALTTLRKRLNGLELGEQMFGNELLLIHSNGLYCSNVFIVLIISIKKCIYTCTFGIGKKYRTMFKTFTIITRISWGMRRL